MDTIFALATVPGKSGVAVIRLSGPQAIEGLRRLNPDLPKPRVASVRVLQTADGSRLDEALVLVFEDGRSFTGEQSVEIQCHGSVAVVQAILSELSMVEGLRSAEPGEFTRRALQNDKLDIAQVEGLADLIEAETEAQRRQAMRVLSGDLGKAAEIWRRDLIRAAALIEATIDFVDEDVPVDVRPEVQQLIDKTVDRLSMEIKGIKTAERIRTGFEVAIVGAPNVGKSTLLNALAGREAAITSEIEGTTRDVIEVRMDLGGLPVTILDTAGIRATDDRVEAMGVERARERAKSADLRVVLHCDGDLPDVEVSSGDIVVQAKGDLIAESADSVSGKTGAGVAQLLDRITKVLADRSASAGIATRLRHQEAMVKAVSNLTKAKEFLAYGEESADLTAEELRFGIRALDSLVGRVDVESVLDEIFASFCLGK